jgi:hypothetical protein
MDKQEKEDRIKIHNIFIECKQLAHEELYREEHGHGPQLDAMDVIRDKKINEFIPVAEEELSRDEYTYGGEIIIKGKIIQLTETDAEILRRALAFFRSDMEMTDSDSDPEFKQVIDLNEKLR